MTIQEAYEMQMEIASELPSREELEAVGKRLSKESGYYKRTMAKIEQCEIVLDALRKQTGQVAQWGMQFGHCPNCQKEIYWRMTGQYCIHCGQKLEVAIE